LTAAPEKVAISGVQYCSAPLHGAPPDTAKVRACTTVCQSVAL
jgi:hypothetical protein